MKLPLSDHTRAGLYLCGVVPALAEAAALDAEAKAAAEPLPPITFQTLSGLEGRAVFKSTSGGLRLVFLTDRQALSCFQQKAALPPVPVSGFQHLLSLKHLDTLSARLKSLLKPSIKPETPQAFEAFFSLSLGVALRSIAFLARTGLLEDTGTVQFALGRQGPQKTLLLDGPRSALLEEPSRPSVLIRFNDTDTAWSALRGPMDAQTAVNSGRITVEGRIPLADHLNQALEVVHASLQ